VRTLVISNLPHLLPRRDEDGQTLVEYGLLLALIAIIVFASLLVHGPIVSAFFTDMGNSLEGT